MCFNAAINKGDVKDTEMEAIMDNIVDSLFSVFVTMGELQLYRTIHWYSRDIKMAKGTKILHCFVHFTALQDRFPL